MTYDTILLGKEIPEGGSGNAYSGEVVLAVPDSTRPSLLS